MSFLTEAAAKVAAAEGTSTEAVLDTWASNLGITRAAMLENERQSDATAAANALQAKEAQRREVIAASVDIICEGGYADPATGAWVDLTPHQIATALEESFGPEAASEAIALAAATEAHSAEDPNDLGLEDYAGFRELADEARLERTIDERDRIANELATAKDAEAMRLIGELREKSKHLPATVQRQMIESLVKEPNVDAVLKGIPADPAKQDEIVAQSTRSTNAAIEKATAIDEEMATMERIMRAQHSPAREGSRFKSEAEFQEHLAQKRAEKLHAAGESFTPAELLPPTPAEEEARVQRERIGAREERKHGWASDVAQAAHEARTAPDRDPQKQFDEARKRDESVREAQHEADEKALSDEVSAELAVGAAVAHAIAMQERVPSRPEGASALAD